MGSTELCSPAQTAQDLLLEFKATGRQEPFEEIVRRYAGMVFHVCLRITKNNHDAEDATQAVFLTLAVQARQNKEIRYIGPWLQQVAHRLSLDLRKSKKRREKREERHGQTAGCEQQECECSQQMHHEELKGLINQEINKLPVKYRMPLILHYFGGLSREEMAKELDCKPGTLGVRLHRAREMLGQRLARRGIAMGEGSMSLAVAYAVQSVVAEQIISSTCQAASQIVIGNPVMGHLVPAQLVAMARGAVHSVLMAKVKTVAALLVAMGCAVAAGAEVVSKVTPLDLGLDLQLRIGDWVKEHLMPLSSPLQVNVADAPRAEHERPAAEPMPFIGHGAIALETPSQRILPPLAPPLRDEAVVFGGSGTGAGQDIALRPYVGLAPAMTIDHAPRRVAPQWDAPASRAATAAPVSVLPRSSSSGFAHLSTPGVSVPRVGSIPAAPDVRGRDKGRLPPYSPRVNGPRVGYLPRPDHPGNGQNNGIGGNGNGNGGNPPPTRPPKPTTPPVQVATGNAGSVNLYLGPVTTPPTLRAPRSPAAMTLRTSTGNSDSNYSTSPATSGSFTHANFDSVTDAIFQVPPRLNLGSTTTAGGNVVLHTEGAFSGSNWGTVADLDVLNASASDAGSMYTDRTFFRYHTQTQELVVIGVRSRAMLNGLTLPESNEVRLSGWGSVVEADTFDQSGQVIADGRGQKRELDLSHVGSIRNYTDNTGANGWYARNGGKVVLPEMRVLPGTRRYTWGEDASDSELDLVNSVRVRVRNALTPGRLKIALSATDRGDVPPIPTGETIVGLWQVDAAGLQADGADLTVRYDDGLIADLGMNEQSVRLWGFNGSWKPVDEGFALDTTSNIVSGSAGSVTFFAVAVTPEPGALGLMVGASLLMLRRRRLR